MSRQAARVDGGKGKREERRKQGSKMGVWFVSFVCGEQKACRGRISSRPSRHLAGGRTVRSVVQ